MFRVCLIIVSPGGGGDDYSLNLMVPALPREGDYVSVVRSGDDPPDEEHTGSEDFIVRRVSWKFVLPDDGTSSLALQENAVGMVTQIVVECEFAIGADSSKSHKAIAGADARHFRASAS